MGSKYATSVLCSLPIILMFALITVRGMKTLVRVVVGLLGVGHRRRERNSFHATRVAAVGPIDAIVKLARLSEAELAVEKRLTLLRRRRVRTTLRQS